MDETLANTDSAEAASVRLVGTVLDNKYRVERILGAGGMGYVVAASHVDLGTKVAIKFMIPDLNNDKGAVSRFMREARASVRITGEHVARVLDVSRMQDGTPYMVMEHLEGCDLSEVLDQQGRLEPEQAVDFVLQACEAIAEAHRIGIVHRDLKPSNLFMTQRADGSALIKVLDFGISKVRIEGVDQTKLTATQTLLGSPTYMSPEQVRRPDSVDQRSDVWTLGVILFELLSDGLPFVGDSHMSVLAGVVSDPIPDVHELIPWIDASLAAVIQRCLVRDLNERTPDVGQFARELAEFAPPQSLASIDRISAVLARQDNAVTPQGISRKPELGTPAPGARSRSGYTPSSASGNERTVQATPTPKTPSSEENSVETVVAATSAVGTPVDARTDSHAPVSKRDTLPAPRSRSRMIPAAAGAALLLLGMGAYLMSASPDAPEADQAESPRASEAESLSAVETPEKKSEDTGEQEAAAAATSPKAEPAMIEKEKGDSEEDLTAPTPRPATSANPVAAPRKPRPAPSRPAPSPAPALDPLDGRF